MVKTATPEEVAAWAAIRLKKERDPGMRRSLRRYAEGGPEVIEFEDGVEIEVEHAPAEEKKALPPDQAYLRALLDFEDAKRRQKERHAALELAEKALLEHFAATGTAAVVLEMDGERRRLAPRQEAYVKWRPGVTRKGALMAALRRNGLEHLIQETANMGSLSAVFRKDIKKASEDGREPDEVLPPEIQELCIADTYWKVSATRA